MMRRYICETLAICLVGASLTLMAQSPGKSSANNPAGQTVPAAKTGEQVFNNNCQRCHKPPMVIGPRITGTIVMHMRTRARLSREDEKLLLHYLAP